LLTLLVIYQVPIYETLKKIEKLIYSYVFPTFKVKMLTMKYNKRISWLPVHKVTINGKKESMCINNGEWF
jgi:hypothetical protein